MGWFNCKVDDRSKVVGGAQRIETPDGYVFRLSSLVACTPSGSLLMMTFGNIPMSSSHHLTFDILLFWTMALHLPLMRKSIKKLMILCSKIPCLMNLEIFTNEWYITWMFSGIQTLQSLGIILFLPIYTRAILLRKIGNHSGPFLDGNINRLSKTPTRLPHVLEVLSLNMITSRKASSPAILFSTFPGGINLLLLILSLVTHLPSMMEVPWPSTSLERILMG